MAKYGLLLGLPAIALAAASAWALPLHDAARAGNGAEVARLIDAGADLQALDESALTPLVAAALAGQTEIVALLIENGADPEGRDGNGYTALHAAAYEGHGAIVDLLLEQEGVDVSDQENDARLTPLHAAAERNFLAIAATLLANDADTELTEGSGWTPIMRASFKSHADMVKLLRDHGAICLEELEPFTSYCKTAGDRTGGRLS